MTMCCLLEFSSILRGVYHYGIEERSSKTYQAGLNFHEITSYTIQAHRLGLE